MAVINDPNTAANITAVKAPSTAPVATDCAAVVTISPNTPALPVSIAATVPVSIAATVAVSAASLPLPAGASTAANQTTLGNQTTKINDGTNTAAVKAASTAPVATDPALVVAVSPNTPTLPVSIAATVAVSASSLPLPAGAATSANQTTLGNQTTKINDGTNTAAVKAASTAPVATDPALVVSVSPNTPTLPISAASLPLPAGASTAANQATLIANQTTLGSQTTKINDGTTTSAVKAASTQPVAADAALVVTLSPNGANAVAQSALPAAVAGGTFLPPMTDVEGRLVTCPVVPRTLVGTQVTTIAGVATETTIITAGAAGVFNDIIGLIISTTIAVAQTITIRDATGGAPKMIFNYPAQAVTGSGAAAAPLVISFPVPVPQTTAANNWTAQNSSATGSTNITAIYAKNK